MHVGFCASLIIFGVIGLLASQPLEARAEPVSATLVADVDAVVPGQTVRLGVRLSVAPKWHVYWLNAGDQGEPTRVRWTLPDGFSAGDLRFPTPSVYTLPGPIVSFGYEDQVLLVSSVTVPDTLDQQTVRFVADVSWMACDVTCVLGESRAELTLPVGSRAGKANETLFAAHDASLPKPAIEVDPRAALALEPAGEGRFTLLARVRLPEGAQDAEFFPPAVEGGAWSDVRVEIDAGQVAVVHAALRSFGATPARVTAEAVLAWRESDGSRASVLFPAEQFKSTVSP